MRKLLVLPFLIATLLLGACVADARPATYRVTGTWLLTYVDGTPTVKPRMEDDYVEVTCRHGDQMRRHRVNDHDLVADAWPRVDGTGIQITPEFTGRTEILRITVTCRRGSRFAVIAEFRGRSRSLRRSPDGQLSSGIDGP